MIISIVATFIPLNTLIFVIDLLLVVSLLYLQEAIINDFYWVALLVCFIYLRFFSAGKSILWYKKA